MKLTHKQLDLVTAYVKSEISGKALTDFETVLAANEILREEVAFQRSLLSAVRLNVAANMLQQVTLDNPLEGKTLHPQFEVVQNNLQQARIDNINRQRRIRKHWIRGLAVAASMILVSFFGLKMYLNNQLNSDMEQLAATVKYERISLTENIKDVSARRTVIAEQLGSAERAFEEEDWETTQQIFEYLRDTLLYNSADMDFYEGIIFYHKKEYTKSIETLENINLDEAESVCQIRHFLTLSYLKINDKTKAKEQYRILAESIQKCDEQDIKQLEKYFIL